MMVHPSPTCLSLQGTPEACPGHSLDPPLLSRHPPYPNSSLRSPPTAAKWLQLQK